jgi:hypothetical protein
MAGMKKRLKYVRLRCQSMQLRNSGPWLAADAVLLLLFSAYLILHHIRVNWDCASFVMWITANVVVHWCDQFGQHEQLFMLCWIWIAVGIPASLIQRTVAAKRAATLPSRAPYVWEYDCQHLRKQFS